MRLDPGSEDIHRGDASVVTFDEKNHVAGVKGLTFGWRRLVMG